MEAKSKITLLISNRGDKVKRALFRKAVAETYAKLGIEPLWNGKVSKRIINMQ